MLDNHHTSAQLHFQHPQQTVKADQLFMELGSIQLQEVQLDIHEELLTILVHLLRLHEILYVQEDIKSVHITMVSKLIQI